jgi:hypothetical protein
MVEAFIDLSKGTFPQALYNLISESYMIAYLTYVFGILIIKTTVVYALR